MFYTPSRHSEVQVFLFFTGFICFRNGSHWNQEVYSKDRKMMFLMFYTPSRHSELSDPTYKCNRFQTATSDLEF